MFITSNALRAIAEKVTFRGKHGDMSAFNAAYNQFIASNNQPDAVTDNPELDKILKFLAGNPDITPEELNQMNSEFNAFELSRGEPIPETEPTNDEGSELDYR